MTDTDDTDELLLIPPDFFSIESDSNHPDSVPQYYNIVDKLIKQVDSLQTRLKSIETSKASDFALNMDTKQDFRRFNSTDDLPTRGSFSAQNTPQKPSSKFRLSSLPNSPNIDRFNYERKNFNSKFTDDSALNSKHARDQPINEVDTFLSKVKSIQRLSTVRNLENDFDNYKTTKPKEEPYALKTTWQCGDNKDSVPDYGMGMRDALYDNDKLKSDNFDSLSPPDRHRSFSDSSTDSTLTTAYAKSKSNRTDSQDPIHFNALKAIDMHKKLMEESSVKRTPYKKKSRSSVGEELGLMNLADIWGNKGRANLNVPELMQKLQEEKCRRQHCENIIQELQTRNLEMQQKVSVAVKVDDSKNKTIQQLQDTVEKLLNRFEKLNREKIDREFDVEKLKKRLMDEKEETNQRIHHYESEASKALNLAHANQEKSVALERKCCDLEAENHSLKKKLESLEQNYAKECDKNKQIADILTKKEVEINENKLTLSNASAEINQSRKTIENCEREFARMKEDYHKIDEKLKEERNQTVKLNKEIMDLLDELESRKKREVELQEEIAALTRQLQSNKVDLRNFYQGQVEILVQGKLKEFQCQLDRTEDNFKEEIKKREMAVAKSAAEHLQRLSEKSSLEIKLLERKHREEIKLYRIEVMKYKQQAESIQNRLLHFQEKRVSVAKQLQKVMESQWSEAMKIIANGKSPSLHEESPFSTIDQLNNLKTKSYSNLEEVLSQHDGIEHDVGCSKGRDIWKQEEPLDTPVSSKMVPLTKPGIGEAEIQKYINMFLNKAPGNAGLQDDLVQEMENQYLEDLNRDKEDGSRTGKGQQKDRKGLKPPWK
ncbi:unnamed protein product [Phyllotreta striolata]|uniref:Uncharacterized protein n=1 Tax=Phyllotreta striolata TaxID=444603 RepID=A0A9P0DUU6_PHYSR|nr:unnamed protein product [Phyllotreta striolata]